MPIAFANIAKLGIPKAKIKAIKDAVLGVGYELGLAVVAPAEIKKLNMAYRGINKPTDILSFPLCKSEGEIYLCPEEAKKEAKKFGRSDADFLAFLFIHGCAHLKGYDHGARMEALEAKMRKRFKI